MFVMSYFRTEAEALHLAVSRNGLHWRPVLGGRPVLLGEVGTRTLRDPFLFRDVNGGFHLLATDGWRSECIVHATSEDLLTWSPQRLIPVMAGVTGCRNCWAPECCFDPDQGIYWLFWSSTIWDGVGTDPGHRIWATTTRDFQVFTPAEPFFDPGYSVIDATIAATKHGFLMAYKDERGTNSRGTEYKAIRTCAAARIPGHWEDFSDLLTPALTEGPTLLDAGNRWIMLFDHFMDGHFGAIESEDLLTWRSVTDRVEIPFGPRHASVISLDPAAYARLESLV